MVVFAFTELHRAFWTIAVGSVCGAACALVGCFLLLRRMSLMGDALSHGILPGIALAVILTGQIASWPIFLGAMIFGVLTAALAEGLQTWGKVNEDAALGVVFTTLFAVGVILISQSGSHLDTCIFYGHFEFIPLDTFDWAGFEIPQVFPGMVLALVATMGAITLLWKELKLATFDPGLASAMGYSAPLLRYLLIGLVAGVTVTAFEAFGNVLVLAFLVVPAATAHLLTDRMVSMLFMAVAAVISAVIIGYFVAVKLVGGTIGGMMALALGAQFLAVVLFAPRHGVVVKVLRRRRLALRIATEEILAGLFRQEEGAVTDWLADMQAHGLPPSTERRARRRLKQQGWIDRRPDGGPTLTDAGRTVARSIVRSHRLWETFLGQHFELPLDHLHAPASRVEHFIGPQLQQELAQELETPAVDPHGKSIPRSK